MSALHHALTEYLAARRALGTRLKWPESSLRRFVDFVDAEGAEVVTMEIAVRWAVQAQGVQRATHARRLAIVRGFAVWLQAADRRTQVPPQRLLPAAYQRPAPHIYSDREIANLMTAAVSPSRSSQTLRHAVHVQLEPSLSHAPAAVERRPSAEGRWSARPTVVSPSCCLLPVQMSQTRHPAMRRVARGHPVRARGPRPLRAVQTPSEAPGRTADDAQVAAVDTTEVVKRAQPDLVLGLVVAPAPGATRTAPSRGSSQPIY